MENKQENITNALKILLISRDRGRVALDKLQNGCLEDFFAAQRKFNIAFNNFKSLDYIVQQQGQDLFKHENAKKLLTEIDENNKIAIEMVKINIEKTKTTLTKNNSTSKIISNYSTKSFENKFIKSI